MIADTLIILSLPQSLISSQSPFRTQDKTDEGSVPESAGRALAQPDPRPGEVRRTGGRRQDGGPGRGGAARGGVPHLQRDPAPHPQHQGHQPLENKTPGE